VLYWYIFYVYTGRENSVLRCIQNQFHTDVLNPFIPMLETIHKKSGKYSKETTIMFPGYVFMETEMNSTLFSRNILSLIRQNKNIIKILKYGDSDEIAMREEEQISLLALCNDNYCIKSSEGIIAGDKIIINKGPLQGRESTIRKIDRHKREAIIELEIIGGVRLIKVALEILEKF